MAYGIINKIKSKCEQLKDRLNIQGGTTENATEILVELLNRLITTTLRVATAEGRGPRAEARPERRRGRGTGAPHKLNLITGDRNR